MNDSTICLSRNNRSNDSSPSVRVEVSSSLNPSHLITDKSAHEIISIIGDSSLEKLSRGLLDKGASYIESSFDILSSDEDAEDDRVATCMLVSFQVT